MADDVLRRLPEEAVAGWYRRLADRIALESVNGQAPLASTLLRLWLDNRDSKFVYPLDPPLHLRVSPHVQAVQRFHRDVFLTKQKGRFTGGATKWVGVVPRFQGEGYPKWDARSPLTMAYESLVEIGSGPIDMYRIRSKGTPAEKDLFTALRGFQLRSSVRVSGFKIGATPKLLISFESWECVVKDRYDWDYSEHLTIPNPDYMSKSADAVRPDLQEITVFHRNAQRIENKGLATPFDIESKAWTVSDDFLVRPEEVDTSRKLK